MNKRVAQLALVFCIAGAVSVGCGSEDDSTTPPKGGAGGLSGSAGKAGSAGHGGSSGSGLDAGSGNESGSAGDGAFAGGPGTDQGGAAGSAGDRGDAAGSSQGGEGGEGGEAPVYSAQQIERGKVLVGSMALCGGCHTAASGSPLGGNPAFGGNLGAPNLTNDPSGIGDASDARVINAFRNGIAIRKDSNDQDRHLNQAMPYWLYHNLTDDDALAIVAYLRSLTPVVAVMGTGKPDAVPVTPFAPSSFPETTLLSTDPEYAAAQKGKYLVSGVVACVKCHSPAASGLPIPDFFSGVAPADPTKIFPPNITPDVTTGIGGWTADDVQKALKQGINKAGVVLCGSMPSAAKGYGGMSDADAHAIGVYLTTIPGINKPSTDPDLEPACPPPPPAP